jgi:hypothetical protein
MQLEHHQLDPIANQEDRDDVLTPQQRAELADPAKQAEYGQAFQQQLDRQACPGCGES